jgi:hypothetical protein
MKKNTILQLFFCFTVLAFISYSCSKEKTDNNENDITLKKAGLLTKTGGQLLSSNYHNPLVAPAGSATRTLIDAADLIPVDEIWAHIENGDNATLYQPIHWNHTDTGVAATSYTFPEPLKHIADGGPDNSTYVPTDFVHIATGPRATRYGPPGFTHIATGGNKTKYKWGRYIHIDAGKQKTYFKRL